MKNSPVRKRASLLFNIAWLFANFVVINIDERRQPSHKVGKLSLNSSKTMENPLVIGRGSCQAFTIYLTQAQEGKAKLSLFEETLELSFR